MASRPEGPRPRVIAHRGACGILPEHTLEGYSLAIEQGADAIELDLVPTRDGVLIARHDNDLSVTTDIADRPEFRDRRRIKSIDGKPHNGFFSEDFTADEVKRLRVRQRMPFRNRSFDGRFSVPTLAEVLELARTERRRIARPLAVYLELKSPSEFVGDGVFRDWPAYWAALGDAESGEDLELCVESFETTPLLQFRDRGGATVCQLIDEPSLRPDPNSPRQFANLITLEGLREIRTYADTIGVWKELIVPTLPSRPERGGDPRFHLAPPTDLLSKAHATELRVEAWTFRDEPQFLAREYAGDPLAEYRHFGDLGVEGVISDYPATALHARQH